MSLVSVGKRAVNQLDLASNTSGRRWKHNLRILGVTALSALTLTSFIGPISYAQPMPANRLEAVSVTTSCSDLTAADALEIHNGNYKWNDPQNRGLVDMLLLNHEVLDPEADDDGDGIPNKKEISVCVQTKTDDSLQAGSPGAVVKKHYYEYHSHPLLADTDGDGIKDGQDKDPLSWDVDSRDTIFAMELSYRDDNYARRILDNDTEFLRSDWHGGRPSFGVLHKEMAPYWNFDRSWHKDNGFSAMMLTFSNKTIPFLKDKSVNILAIRGTDDSKDIGSDMSLAVGQWPAQADSATALADEIFNLGYKNLSVTGHSLGGFLGQIFTVRSIGARYGYELLYPDGRNYMLRDPDKKNNQNFVRLYTYNAPKIKHGSFAYWMWEYGGLGDVITQKLGSRHYRTRNDSVTNATGAFDGYIELAASDGGHSSTSFFEPKYIDQPGFSVGNRRGFGEGEGYLDPLLEKVSSIMVKPTTIIFKTPQDKELEKIVVGKTEEQLRAFHSKIPQLYADKYEFILCPTFKYGEENYITVNYPSYKLTYNFKYNNSVIQTSEVVVRKHDESYQIPAIPVSNDPNYEYKLAGSALTPVDLETISSDQTIDVDLVRVEKQVKVVIKFVNLAGKIISTRTEQVASSEVNNLKLNNIWLPAGYHYQNPDQRLTAGENTVVILTNNASLVLPLTGGSRLALAQTLALLVAITASACLCLIRMAKKRDI